MAETDGGAVDRPDLESKPKSVLEKEVASRDLPVEGSGSGGTVVKDDLVAAIAADDEAPEDTSGRPPLAEVAEDRASNVIERVVPGAEED